MDLWHNVRRYADKVNSCERHTALPASHDVSYS
jgi:hypothetical protein